MGELVEFPGIARVAPRPGMAGMAGRVAFLDLAPYGQAGLLALLAANGVAALVDLRPCPVFGKPRFRHREVVAWLQDADVRYIEYAMEVRGLRDAPDRERREACAMADAVGPHLARGLVACIHDAAARDRGWLDAMRRVMRHHPGCAAEIHPRALAGWLPPGDAG